MKKCFPAKQELEPWAGPCGSHHVQIKYLTRSGELSSLRFSGPESELSSAEPAWAPA